MARPSYPGVLYFPLDCHLDDDMKLIQAEYGLAGFAVVVKLYQKIYGELGYYCEWNRDVGLLFAQTNGVGYNFVSEVVGVALRRGIFCEELFHRYGILTSRGIQRRYLKMVERRVGEKISPGYALVECAQKQEDTTETPKNITETPVSVCGNAEKGNKIKEYNTLSIARAPARGKHQNVFLTDEEYHDILTIIPDADTYIDLFSEKLYQKGYQYSNHHDSILEWWEKDKNLESRRKKSGTQSQYGYGDREHYEQDELFKAATERIMKGL